MDILFLTRKWPPAMGGMETWSVELVSELARDHDMTLHKLPGRANGAPPGALALLGFGLRTAISVLFDRRAYDVVAAGDLAMWPLVWLAGLFRKGTARGVAAHGTDASFASRSGMVARLYAGYLRLGARLLPQVRIVANSDATAGLVRALGYRQVAVVPLATRAGHSPPPDPDNTLLLPGRILPRKGLRWFVENVLPQLPETLFLQVAGTIWDADEATALSHPRVHHLGQLDAEALARRMATARAVILPNIPTGPGHFEGFGLVAVEAAAAGAVVLASRLDGFTTSVIEGETGFLVAGIRPAEDATFRRAGDGDTDAARPFRDKDPD